MFAAASSKVPFYVAGGLLVVWAVLLAAWGISHAEFPGSAGASAPRHAHELVLVAATLTAAVVTGGEGTEGTRPRRAPRRRPPASPRARRRPGRRAPIRQDTRRGSRRPRHGLADQRFHGRSTT